MPRLALLVLLAACSTPPGEGPPDPTPAPPGVDPTVPAGPGEVRAGVVVEGGESALWAGITAEGRPGDISIYNDRVRFVVQGPYLSHGYVNTGGGLLDADLVRPEG